MKLQILNLLLSIILRVIQAMLFPSIFLSCERHSDLTAFQVSIIQVQKAFLIWKF
jgi:hypothetical protein